MSSAFRPRINLFKTATYVRPQQQQRSLHRLARARHARSSRHFMPWSFAVAGTAFVWYWLESYEIPIRVLHTASADEKPTSHIELDQTPVHLDPDTSMPFPTVLETDNSQDKLVLTGLGVRTVSFLRVQVYSVGTYFAQETLASLKGRPNLQFDGEALVSDILDMPQDVAVRIVPVKTTDHAHLRDGFVRAMLARMQTARRAGRLSPDEEEAAGLAIETFKGFFPTGKVPKGKSLILIHNGRNGSLLLEYEGRLMGILQNKFLAKEMMLAYFADNGKEISPKMKTDVMAGLQRYL